MDFLKKLYSKKGLLHLYRPNRPISVVLVACALFIYIVGFSSLFTIQYKHVDAEAVLAQVQKIAPLATPKLDTKAYDAKMAFLAHTATTTSTSTPKLWPVKAAYPNAGALLPFNRIVAYYGNFYSKGMGVLGEYPTDQMIAKLQAEVKVWQAADPKTPVIPAIHYIVETAQGSPGKEGKYLLRMPESQIDIALADAEKVHGIVFLDFQVALSSLPAELPNYVKYLAMPNVHLGVDPEFSMHNGARPGTVIGIMDATDINYAANFLAALVKANNLPPKMLVIHRFTEGMVTNYKNIKPLPEVQIVMDMDGWGFGAKKINTYNQVIYPEPVQFTGFKLFYKNDVKPPSTRMLTPAEILKLIPSPSYIQYQ